MLNFPKIPKIALRKFSELSTTLWRSKGDFRVKLTFFWVALHMDFGKRKPSNAPRQL